MSQGLSQPYPNRLAKLWCRYLRAQAPPEATPAVNR
jgi:hypothetical protein